MNKSFFFILFFLPCINFAQSLSTDKIIELNSFLDSWHLAAADVNLEAYFGKMDSGFIYLGTDASERWTKNEFRNYAKPYFDKGKAWTFKAASRNWYFSNDGNYAWFDELLDTQMGKCRGSGVLHMTREGWKLLHYNLAVTVPNEKIKAFINLMK